MRRRAGAYAHRARSPIQRRRLVRERLRAEEWFVGQLVKRRCDGVRRKRRQEVGRKIGFKDRDKIRQQSRIRRRVERIKFHVGFRVKFYVEFRVKFRTLRPGREPEQKQRLEAAVARQEFPCLPAQR